MVRTAGLYGLHGSASKGGNFVTRMIARAREQGALKVVADQLLTPTFTADLAAGIVAALDAGATGILHVTNSGATSWHDFTEAIMELAGLDVPVEPGPLPSPLAAQTARSTACCDPPRRNAPAWSPCVPGGRADGLHGARGTAGRRRRLSLIIKATKGRGRCSVSRLGSTGRF